MESLFDTAENRNIIARIEKLNASSQPLWGKMNVAQMLTHVQQPLKVGIGELNLKQMLIGRLLGGMAKKKLLKPGQFEHNLPTANEFKIKTPQDFQESKAKLVLLIEKYLNGGKEILTK